MSGCWPGRQARPHDALRIVITWVFNRTGESLPLSALVHVSNNNAFVAAEPRLIATTSSTDSSLDIPALLPSLVGSVRQITDVRLSASLSSTDPRRADAYANPDPPSSR
jgi:hypothetical protein